MTESNLGRTAGFVAVGTVVNRKDDPSQTGKCKVRWNIGGVNQDQLQEHELPWSDKLHGSSNPSLGNKGGIHTGLLEGSTVIGISPAGDGQDIVIIGSLVKSGNGNPDSTPTWDSDLPIAAKDQNNGQGGGSQPKYDDINGVVTQQSLVDNYGPDQGGPDQRAAKYPKPMTIGTREQPIDGDA